MLLGSGFGWNELVRRVSQAKTSRVMVLTESAEGLCADACVAVYLKLAVQAAEDNPTIKAVLHCSGSNVRMYRNLTDAIHPGAILKVSPSAMDLESADLLFLAPESASELFTHQPGQIRVAFSRGPLSTFEGSTDHMPFDVVHTHAVPALVPFKRVVAIRYAFWLSADKKHQLSEPVMFLQSVEPGSVRMKKAEAETALLLHSSEARDSLAEKGFILIAEAPFEPEGSVLVQAASLLIPKGCFWIHVVTEWRTDLYFVSVGRIRAGMAAEDWIEHISIKLSKENSKVWRALGGYIQLLGATSEPEAIAKEPESIVFEAYDGEG